MGINKFFKKSIKIITEIIENLSQIDAQNTLKSSLGVTLGFNLSSFGTEIQKMDVGIEKMNAGMWKMGTGSRYPVVDPPVSGKKARGNRSKARTRKAVTANPGEGVVQIY